MKIKDILESVDSIKKRIYTAYRIFYSSPRIKNAIKEWKMYKDLPVIRVRVAVNGERFIEISAYDLVNYYGFDELSSLLMIDEIEKAQEKQDTERLNILLSFMVRGKHEMRVRVKPELLEQIKQNSPEVWTEYQKLCKKTEAGEKEMEERYSSIIETEL